MVAHPAEADTCATDSAMLGGLAMLLGAGGDPRVIQRLSVDGPTLLARLRANAFTLADAEGRDGDIQWNFEKFLIAADGEVIARFAPTVVPDDPAIVSAIESALA